MLNLLNVVLLKCAWRSVMFDLVAKKNVDTHAVHVMHWHSHPIYARKAGDI